ncbi:MAG: right-handed parallel beta-helix repeat-containing protein [Verrucomicrobiota bacterium]
MNLLRVLFLSIIAFGSLQAQTIYVDDDALPGGDGMSWGTAYQDLQEALATAAFGSQIWVAEGSYYPDEGIGQVDNDVNSTFQLASGVEIYGGFPNGGSATMLSDRDPALYSSILSGDLDKDSAATGNAESVVTGSGADATALLDGFTISFGNSSSGTLGVGGAGIRCEGLTTAPVIRGCRFTDHRSLSNGIISIHTTSLPGPRFVNCEIVGNYARGLMGFDAVGSFENVLIANNFNDSDVVGVRLDGASDMSFTNCTVAHNANLSTSTGASGGFFMRTTSVATIQNTIIWGNTTNITSFTTAENNYDVNGLAVGTFSNCVVEGWAAVDLGGAGNLDGTDPTDDPLLADPSGDNFRLSFGSPVINAGNNAFSMESSDLDGETRIQDGIINLGAYEGLVPRADGVESLSYDIGDGNFFPTVLDLRAVFNDGLGQFTYALSSNSNPSLVTPVVAIDDSVELNFIGATRGIARLVFSADFNGNLGFYELLVYRGDVLHVDASVGSPGAGTSWATAFDDLQTAMAASVAGDQIWVAGGTYYPDTGTGQSNDDAGSTFALKNAVRYYGGFNSSGAPAMVDQRDWFANPVVLSGDLQQDDTVSAPTSSGNAYHVVTVDSLDDSVVFDGFQIEAGYADGTDAEDQDGGGMQVLNSSIAVCNVLISGCYADDNGGGLYVEGGTTGFTNLGLYGNRAGNRGGGCTFDSTGGLFVNVTAAGNYSENDGGAFYRDGSGSAPKPTMVNGLVWDNMTGTGTGVSFAATTTTFGVVCYSLVEGINFNILNGFMNKGNIDGDGAVAPVFLYSPAPQNAPQVLGDLRLDARSTLGVDLGDSSANPKMFDLAHATRVSGSEIDMGAYEGQLAVPYPDQESFSLSFTTNEGSSVVNAIDLSSGLTNPGGAITYSLLQNFDPSFVTGVVVNPSTGQVDLSFSGTGSTTLIFLADNGQGPGYITVVVERTNVYFVDEDVAVPGVGDSWSNAFANLQDALAVAVAPSQIWIAEGSYQPDEGGGNTALDRNASFVIPAGISLLGGFEAGDTSASDRNPEDHPVILTGDLAQDDDPAVGLTSYDDNSFSVVQSDNMTSDPIDAANGVLLDSLTITGGCGFAGAAVFADKRFLEIVDCRIIHNPITTQNAPFFGSVVIEDGLCSMSGTEVSDNHLLADPLPSGNPEELIFGAGGVVSLGGKFHAYDSRFLDNSGTPPGHISVVEGSTGTSGTVGDSGYVTSGAAVLLGNPEEGQTFTNCKLQGNQGHIAGGILLDGSVLITNTLIAGNRAIGVDAPNEGAGALALLGSGVMTMLNCTVTANRSVFGGAFEVTTTGNQIINSVILNNLTENNDAGMLVFNPITATNLGGEGSPFSIYTSFVEGRPGEGGATFPAFQSFINPGFPIPAPHQDGDYRALSGTNGEGTTGRLIDMGDDSDYAFWLGQVASEVADDGFTLPGTIPDLGGSDRVQGGEIEIGAYEGETDVGYDLIFPEFAASGDESANGVSNFEQYAAGLELTATEIPGLQFEITFSENYSYNFTYRQRANIADLTSNIQISPDLYTPFVNLAVSPGVMFVRTSAGLVPFSNDVDLPEDSYLLGNDLVVEKSANAGLMLPNQNFFRLQSLQDLGGGP